MLSTINNTTKVNCKIPDLKCGTKRSNKISGEARKQSVCYVFEYSRKPGRTRKSLFKHKMSGQWYFQVPNSGNRALELAHEITQTARGVSKHKALSAHIHL